MEAKGPPVDAAALRRVAGMVKGALHRRAGRMVVRGEWAGCEVEHSWLMWTATESKADLRFTRVPCGASQANRRFAPHV